MNLRVACKVCETVFGYKRIFRVFRVRYRRGTVAKAMRICRRRWRNRRVPWVPSESELHERAEIHGCMLLDLAEVLGADPEETERKREAFLIAMEACKP